MDRDIPALNRGLQNETLHSERLHKRNTYEENRPRNIPKAGEDDEISDLERFIDMMSAQEESNAIRLYERMALELKAEVSFLRKLNQATLLQDVSMNQVSNSCLRDEIMHLRSELQTKNHFIKLLVSPGSTSSLNEPRNQFEKNTPTNAYLAPSGQEGKKPGKNTGDQHRGQRCDDTDSVKSHDSNTYFSSEKINENKIEIIGDFMLNNIQVRELSKLNHVRISYFSGCKTPDLLNYIKPSLPRKPDKIIIHAGTNDLMSSGNMLFTVEKIIQLVKKESPRTQLAFSSIIVRKDRDDLSERIKRINFQLRNYCRQHNVGFIDNSNITESCLDVSNVHLNRKGNSLLAENFLNNITDE